MDRTPTALSGEVPRLPNCTSNNCHVFEWSMEVLDAHAGAPLLWQSAKSSAWYCVGLLARGRREDVDLALQYIETILRQQYLEEAEVTYGTYKGSHRDVFASKDSLAEPKIYDTYDPNNALFVTIAFIVINANFADLIPAQMLERIRTAMYAAVKGDETRVGGVNEDNLRPCYTNGYLAEALELFDRYHTISEYNSPTYTGVTFMALGVAQYLPESSVVRRKSAALIRGIWDEIGATYNASLTNLSGPWDRTYGYDMTLYPSLLGAVITNVVGLEGKFPLPNPLAAGIDIQDAAAFPLLSLVAPYIECNLPAQARTALTKLQPHSHTAQAFSPPFDARARRYSYFIGEGYSVGGVDFDECVVGGPSINLKQFAPGTIIWDAGTEGHGLGWISYVPTSASCSIIANASSLSIRYPPSKDFPSMPRSNIIRFHIGTFFDMQLDPECFSSPEYSSVALPGMNVRLTGNVVDGVRPRLSYTGESLHGCKYYVLEYALPPEMLKPDKIPELVIELDKVAVERNFSLPAVGTKPVINEPPIRQLRDLPRDEMTVDGAESLVELMRESLVNLKDETGEFLYTFPDGTVVDTKGWFGWDWTQGVALTVLLLHAQVTASSTSVSRSIEVCRKWFESQYDITKGKGAQKNINTMSVFYSLIGMLQSGTIDDQKWSTWVEDWIQWVAGGKDGLPRTREGGFQHVTYEELNHDQLWDDTLFMTCLPLARASILLKRPTYFQLAIAQFLLHAQYLCDTTTGLWFHGWQFGQKGGGHNFARARWARGNAWVTVAVPMLLELMGEAGFGEDAARVNLIQVWRRQVDALLRVQNPDNGMWHTLLDDPESYVETSASAGFVAGIFAGLRLGLVDPALKDAYANAALNGLRAVVAQIGPVGEVSNVSFGTAMGHELQHYKDIPLTSMPYGQALAMLALVEWQRWKVASSNDH